ncbi:UDP-N-acetyl-D-galactosamine dehydrogenase [Staphylococcus sp. HMSC072B07]|uniref:nucleotide sugar dehydrogenase n=1 Tax=Staphylococcus TaxID=1279 RepID=UPI0002992485|nr:MULTISPECIES: nucleotide sugar dehydrogenase [Staphylococcus]AMG96349.1 nucleotide sugar dehydrogenase [Staphylococcus simulans]EKS25918.1 nucleotide sugar dehydrogenase [Staphylococcus simulans ACS-120-V-Sch1]KXA45644.1 nucleotide sugar dehydrogenase [Staphylococcus simulans]MDK8175243.1 nucleotide sugar dehydrogenase [Staphylococcus simulans]OFM19541.1 UDP-N-acetyl-D-galactosamine dehydrogenase [Staphylococcus sp. HMSC059E03]
MKEKKIAVIGMGYVGMPLAIAFAKHFEVIGFDIDENKINKYNNNIDPTGEVGEEVLKNTSLKFTSNENDLKDAEFFIITVPTPIKQDNTPNLAPIESATKLVGKYLKNNDYVVYESTVYPGVTEEVCAPLLEEISGLEVINDFKVGYSPERINPGDKKNTVENIIKIVSGIDKESLDVIAEIYGKVIKAGIHKASNIKVAESAKVVENSQRDINIAFMNELSQVFNLMGINTHEVIDAMNTKWNALGFYPGLVGGHCIGVDPYYFIYRAENLGYHSQIITAGRKINNAMPAFVVNNIIKELMKKGKSSDATVLIAGLTFKENTPDFRNSKVLEMIKSLNEFGIKPKIFDPYINSFSDEIEADIVDMEDFKESVDVLLYAVNHDVFKNIEDTSFLELLKKDSSIIVDLKNRFKKYENDNVTYWSI